MRAAVLFGCVGVLAGAANAFGQTGDAPNMSQIQPDVSREAPIVPVTRPEANPPVAPNRNAYRAPSVPPGTTTMRIPQAMPALPYVPPTANALTGFFPPQPRNDLSLTHMGEAQPASAPPVTVAAPPAESYVQLQSRLNAEQEARAEQEAARAERENEIARQRAAMQPQPINGAFTGLTDEADRY